MISGPLSLLTPIYGARKLRHPCGQLLVHPEVAGHRQSDAGDGELQVSGGGCLEADAGGTTEWYVARRG